MVGFPAWIAAHPVAFVVLVVVAEKILTAFAVWATYPSDPKEWRRIKREEPRRAAIVQFLRGYGFYPAKVMNALRVLVLSILPKDIRKGVEAIEKDDTEKDQ